MIRINLLPYRTARKKENVRRQVSIFILMLILVSIVLGYVHSRMNVKISRLNADIETTKKQIALYEKQVKEIKAIKKELDVLTKKMEIIEKLDTARKGSVKLLDAMTQLIVEKRMWFTSLSATETDLSLSGVALDNKTVADFMVRLETSKMFSNVNLKTLKQTTISNLNLKRFDISCKM